MSIWPQGLARVASLATSAVLLASLAGCGQKGPLFLPGPPPPLQTLQPDTTTSKPLISSTLTPAPALPAAPNRPATQ